jgi:single-strand DNA-binding protein
MSVNKVILVGNLGRDPELRKTQNAQMPVCNLSIATSDRRKDQNGQWVDQTEWHRVVAFGSTAENCSKYLKKGRQIYIEGKLSTRKWTDQEGKERYMTEVIANTIQFLGGRDAGGASAGEGEYRSTAVGNGGDYGSFGGGSGSFGGSSGGSSGAEVTFDDDDIPF